MRCVLTTVFAAAGAHSGDEEQPRGGPDVRHRAAERQGGLPGGANLDRICRRSPALHGRHPHRHHHPQVESLSFPAIAGGLPTPPTNQILHKVGAGMFYRGLAAGGHASAIKPYQPDSWESDELFRD